MKISKFSACKSSSYRGLLAFLVTLLSWAGLFQNQSLALEFGTPPNFPHSVGDGISPRVVAIADYNHDDNPDVAVVNAGTYPSGTGASLSILLLDGNGDFLYDPPNDPDNGVPEIKEYLRPSFFSHSLTAGDLNNDGWEDIVVPNRFKNNISIYLNNGEDVNGEWAGFSQTPTNIDCGSQPVHVALGDFNEDQKLDMAVNDHNNNQLQVFLQNGDGTFEFESALNFTVGSLPDGVAVGYLNGDSHLDIVTTNWGGSSVSVLLGDGTGNFTTPAPSYPIGYRSWSCKIADMNNDGIEDIIAPNAGALTLSVLLGNGDGTFQPQIVNNLGYQSYEFDIADIDYDGNLDFLTSQSAGGIGMRLYLGNGDGTFQSPFSPADSENADWGVVAADIDKDGFLDLVAAEAAVNQVSIFLRACEHGLFSVTPFGPPMGKAKKLGSTLPIKFRMYYDGTEITDQEQLNSLLFMNGCVPSCPTLTIYPSGDSGDLPIDQIADNVGDVDHGNCFRYSAPEWIYNLRLDNINFSRGTTYTVEVSFGDGDWAFEDQANNLFQVK